MTQEQRQMKRDLTRIERWQMALFIIQTLVICALAGLLLGNQHSIMVMQTDTLNTLNDMRMEQDDLESEIAPSDPVSVHSLSPDERDLIERVVASEARGEDLIGMEAVAQTILDRSELWNMTVKEVVQAPGQYADPYSGEISDSIKLAVANVFDGGVRVFEEPVTHFYSGAEPYWAADKVNRGSIGCHRFLY